MKYVIPQERIERMIFFIRGQKVVLDRDLAKLYGVPTFRFNEAIKRHHNRFPRDFAFRLTREEVTNLTSQIAMSKPGRGGRRTLPYAFTEHGAVMAATVLNSPRAVTMSIFVVRAFVSLRNMLLTHKELALKLSELERRIETHDSDICSLFEAIHELMAPLEKPKRRIGFHAELG
jgi:hypothetical protein